MQIQFDNWYKQYGSLIVRMSVILISISLNTFLRSITVEFWLQIWAYRNDQIVAVSNISSSNINDML